MKMYNFPSNKWFSFLWNKYFLVGVFFIVWMLFFDQNSYLLHRQLNNEIEELNNDLEYYQQAINKENKELEYLTTHPEAYEKLAREKYLMKRSNETIFLIESKKDSLNNE